MSVTPSNVGQGSVVPLVECGPQEPYSPPPHLPMDPPCQCPPPLERRNMAPLANGPPLSKEETWPPLRFFHQIAHELPFFA